MAESSQSEEVGNERRFAESVNPEDTPSAEVPSSAMEGVPLLATEGIPLTTLAEAASLPLPDTDDDSDSPPDSVRVSESEQCGFEGIYGLQECADMVSAHSSIFAPSIFAPSIVASPTEAVPAPTFSVSALIPSGQGEIMVYMRRSFEDRDLRPFAAQAESIHAYIKDLMACEGLAPHGVREYFVDDRVGGTRPIVKRPRLSALFEAVAGLEGAHIVVYDITRLARNAVSGVEVRDALAASRATLHLSRSRTSARGSSELARIFSDPLPPPQTSPRVRSAYKRQPGWDPRKSFGWYFPGAGKAPIEVPEEQIILKYLKAKFENGDLVADIVRDMQAKFGNRRCRRYTAISETTVADDECASAPWTTSEITFLTKKHKWVWGRTSAEGAPKFPTRKELEVEARAQARLGVKLETFLAQRRRTYYDGVRINRAMLKLYFPEAIPDWKQTALAVCREEAISERCSIDSVCAALNARALRPGGKSWPRQTAWRFFKEALSAFEADRQASRAAASLAPVVHTTATAVAPIIES